MVLKTRIAPYARLDNMPGFLRSGHICVLFGCPYHFFATVLMPAASRLPPVWRLKDACMLRMPISMRTVDLCPLATWCASTWKVDAEEKNGKNEYETELSMLFITRFNLNFLEECECRS